MEKDKDTNDCKYIRYTYNHDDKPAFHKTIAVVYIGISATSLSYFFVQCYFDCEEHPKSFTKSYGDSKNLEIAIQHDKYLVPN